MPSARSTWCSRTATGTSIAKQGQADTFRFPGAGPVPEPGPVFPDISIQRGPNEKTIAELRADMGDKIKNGISPHPEIITLQQKFSIPVACLVFALVGLALGMSVARDGKLAGFVVGIAVIFAYYIVFLLAESLTKGYYATPRRSSRRPIHRGAPGAVGPQHRAGPVRPRSR